MAWAQRLEDCVDASDYAYCTCKVYSCGYSQPNRQNIGLTRLRNGDAETDCSAGVSWWLFMGGLIEECPWFSTHWMIDYLTDNGFEVYDAWAVEPQRNDVLWRAGHTALYIGDGMQAEALRDENHDAGYEGTIPGDQDDGETVVREYPAGGWTYILRPPAPKPEPEPEPPHEVPDLGKDAVYRMYSGWCHLFTTSRKEAQKLSDDGWRDEGLAWRVNDKGDKVRRLLNPWTGQHLLTASDTEAIELVGKGWQYEGVAMHSKGSVEVYRVCSADGEHMLTTSRKERDTLLTIGWRDEGIGLWAKSAE